MTDITDEEILKIMIDGGEKLCDYALDLWITDKYKLGEAARQQNMKRWSEIKGRIRPLARSIKESWRTNG